MGPFALTTIRNTLAFWNKEQLGIELAPGVDEVSLALVADALLFPALVDALLWRPSDLSAWPAFCTP
jgi:hypothetical protein